MGDAVVPEGTGVTGDETASVTTAGEIVRGKGASGLAVIADGPGGHLTAPAAEVSEPLRHRN
jgi:hypothetical protein